MHLHLCSDRDTALHFLGRTRRSLYYKTYLLANAHERLQYCMLTSSVCLTRRATINTITELTVLQLSLDKGPCFKYDSRQRPRCVAVCTKHKAKLFTCDSSRHEDSL